ncbi:piwi-like protein 1, partial [Leptotrombidium deliense]
QPLIQCLPNERQRRSGITQPILLVPELCILTGLSETLRNDMRVRQQMSTATRLPPTSRVQKLRAFMRRLKQNPNVQQEMTAWNLNFENDLVHLQARILDPEKLNTTIDFKQETGDFSKEIRGQKMPVPVSFDMWGIIVSRRDEQFVHDFLENLRRVCHPIGVTLNNPRISTLDNDTTASFVNACKSIPSHAKMMVIIVPNSNKDRYDAIKKVFCIENPIPSQVVVSRTLSKKHMLMSVCTKIGIQMAVKIGAEPWMLNIPPKSLMVVGYDTYHDSTRGGQSVGGFVCSLNTNLTSFYSRTSYHGNREE